jgi:small subunit ribosomal protein S16
MLVIRLQRTGRKGHAQFRVVVQDSRRTPTSGKIVAALGSYNPHTKTSTLDKEKAAFYLEHGAQPSERVVRLLKAEGVKLPDWVKASDKKAGQIRNTEKLRRNRPPEPEQPAEEVPAAEAETAVEENVTDEAAPAEVETAEEAAPVEEVPAAEADAAAEEAAPETEAEAAAEEAAPSDESADATSDASSQEEAPAKAEKPADK